MPLTFKEFREIVAPYAGRAGKCAAASEVAIFARQVMEYLLYSGSDAGVKRLCIQAHRGCISLPPEVEIPVKVRIDNRSAEVWSKWHTFASDDKNWNRCFPAADVLKEEGARTPLAYPVPPGGSLLGVLATCDEADGASVIIEGTDVTGRPIYTFHQGEKIFGEKFTLKKGEVRYGQIVFGDVTGVTKPVTNGYVVLHAVSPPSPAMRFLADWNPSERRPSYARVRIDSRCGCQHIASVSILCRVRLKDSYLDNELTLFENALAVLVGAQRVQAEVNNDVQIAGYKKQALNEVLEQEGGYKKNSGNPVDVYHPLSGGAIRNIVFGGLGWRGRWRTGL